MEDQSNVFGRSSKLMRTPPQQRDNSNILDPEATSCQLCQEKDTVDMVRCDKCDLWHHFNCVNVTTGIKDQDWECPKCRETKLKEDFHSTRSNISSTSSRRRAAIRLEMLAKEKAIQEQLFRQQEGIAFERAKSQTEFLQKEYEILADMSDIDDTETRNLDDVENHDRRERVNEWLRIQPNAPLHAEDIPFSGVEPNQSSTLIISQPQQVVSVTSTSTSQPGKPVVSVTSSQVPQLEPRLGNLNLRDNFYFGRPPSTTIAPTSAQNNPLETAIQLKTVPEAPPKTTSNGNKFSMHIPFPKFDDLKIPTIKYQPTLSDLVNWKGTSAVSNHRQFIQNSVHAPPMSSNTKFTSLGQSNSQEWPIVVPTSAQNYGIPNISTAQRKKSGQIFPNDGSNIAIPTVNTPYMPASSQVPNPPTDMTYVAASVNQHVAASVNQITYQGNPPTSQSYLATVISAVKNDSGNQTSIPVFNSQPSMVIQPQSMPAINNQSSMPLINNQSSIPVFNSQPSMVIQPQSYQKAATSTIQYQLPLPTFPPVYSTQGFNNQGSFNQGTIPQVSNTQGFTNQPPITTPFVQSQLGPTSTTNNQSFVYQPFNNPGVSMYQGPSNQGPYYQHQVAPMPNCYSPYLSGQPQIPSQLQIAARHAMSKEFPKFGGDPAKWSIFYSAVTSKTQSCGLTNAEVLERLEKSLEGPARKTVQSLLSRPEAVPEIIETLQMRFGRPEIIINTLLSQVKNFPSPQMDKMDTFIDYAMSVRNVNSEIQKNGMWQHLWNPQLIQELVDKLPYEMRMNWGEQKLLIPNPNLSNFSDWLYQKARTACAVTVPTYVERSRKNTEKEDNKRSKNSTNFVHAHLNNGQTTKNSSSESTKSQKDFTNSITKEPAKCQICNGQKHYPSNCSKFLGMSYNDRWETIKSKNRCRSCLGAHEYTQCRNKKTCDQDECTAKHHRLLHKPKTIKASENGETKSCNAHQQDEVLTLRRYIPVKLYGPNGSMTELAFLDDGSDLTLMEDSLAEELDIDGTAHELKLKWTADVVRKEASSKEVSLNISGTRPSNKRFDIAGVRTVTSLGLPSQTIDAERLKAKYEFLRKIPLESYRDKRPRILIGLAHCKLSTQLKIREGKWNEPIATKTRLGWELHGTQDISSKVVRLNLHFNDDYDDHENLHQMVAEFFSLENFGVMKPERTTEALSETRAMEIMKSTTKNIGDRYETGLLWKFDNISLPESFLMAARRFQSLERRLAKDPDLSKIFRTKILDHIEKGYARKLTADEIAETSPITWYLPIFPVTNPKKPGKVRSVWDAAAKVGNISLNSMLLSGPDQLSSLPGVLQRFRERAIAISGDIREMFHQIRIRKEDQQAQRFLWREESSSDFDVYALQVMSFGATCSPSSAQYIKNYNARQFIKKYPQAEKAIRENHYVDDWLDSFHTEEEAIKIINDVKYVHAKGGFEIRNWISNSSRVMSSLGEDPNGVKQYLNFDLTESQTERVLGMWWCVDQDELTYSLRYNQLNQNILTGSERPTKREVLRTLMSIYDPLGFLTAFLVHLKMLLQDIWRSGIKWDEKLSDKGENLYEQWKNWIRILPEIEKIRIPRHYSTRIQAGKRPKIELHVFVDASELAYATVAYFRIEDEEVTECCLIGGKSKVAPLKPLSIPRMELQAAVLGVRFKNNIIQQHSLNISRTVVWSDSSTVLSWLKSDLRKYSQYVGARVGEILETSGPAEWRWVPSKLNPADDATKWKNTFHLDTTTRWFKGPEFLLQAEDLWPKTKKENSETAEELKPKYILAHLKVEEQNFLRIKFEKFDYWARTVAYVRRFIDNVRARIRKTTSDCRSGPITSSEYQLGENALYRIAQWDEFAIDILKLKNAKSDTLRANKTSLKDSSIYRYSPYIDQAGVLRMRGRIDAALNISEDQKRPIILPTHHRITKLVIYDYHRRYLHQNTETVINELKQKFIIPRIRVALKLVVRHCQYCKNRKAKPLPPEMADLPIARLSSYTRPFSYVGIDYAGPFKVVMNKKTLKRWIVLFTCLTIRAVHFEIAHSMSTDSCIMAIGNFANIRGTPVEFYCDCGTNFVGTDNELTREIRNIDPERLVNEYRNSKWNFNPPYSSHMGGSWERLVRSTKNNLYSIMPVHSLNDETLKCALMEVLNVINSRPLTFVSIDPDDPEALTPNHFILGSSNGKKTPGNFPPDQTLFRSNWRRAQQMANDFWRRWTKEYLPMITRRTKWFEQVKPIEVGDVVIIVDEDAPRNVWQKGVVIETIKGKSGRISRAKVQTSTSVCTKSGGELKVQTKYSVKTRPVIKLAVLDIRKSTEAETLIRESSAGVSVTASANK